MSYGESVTARCEAAVHRENKKLGYIIGDKVHNCKGCGSCKTQTELKVEPNESAMFPFKVKDGCNTHEFRSKAMAQNYIDLKTTEMRSLEQRRRSRSTTSGVSSGGLDSRTQTLGL